MVRALGAGGVLVVVVAVVRAVPEGPAEGVMRGAGVLERLLVGRRKRGFWRTFSWKMAVAVSGECARERRLWAMCCGGLLGSVDMVVGLV